MKTASKAAVLLAVAALAAPALLPVLAAQVTTLPAVKVKEPKAPRDEFKGQVVNWTPVTITVRDPKNTTIVRTFTFAADLQSKLQNRYMENGDKVTVVILKGTNTAVKIKGKVRKQP